MNAIDLFAGCGGLSKGFMDAGFDILVGVDNDQAALNTFALNHNGAIAMKADLSKQETFDEIKRIAGNRTIDVVIAGPPCQGFSLTGPRNFDDERNKLYLAVIEIVKQYRPKAFIIENVPGMATLYEGQIKEEILRRFRDMGYNIDCKILCAADYGVPQIRKRLIFMGIREDVGEPKFPEIKFTRENYRTCRDAVSDLPSLENDMGVDDAEYTSEPLTEYQKLMRGNCNVLHNHTVPLQSGINWGLAKLSGSHVNINDAYIRIGAELLERYPQMFPKKQETPTDETNIVKKGHRHNDSIEIIWDDGTVMTGLLEGSIPKEIEGVKSLYPKQISTTPKKSELGKYLRKRMNISEGKAITYKDLQNYGRTSIDVSLQGEGVYYFDFSVNA